MLSFSYEIYKTREEDKVYADSAETFIGSFVIFCNNNLNFL